MGRAGLSLFVVISVASAAHAQDRDLPNADVLFRDGRRAADDGNYALACAKFEASRRIDPAPGTLLNLADCEEARGQLTRAWHDFLELADALPETDERKAVALTRARTLERTMPKLRVRLAKSSEGASVYRDDLELSDTTLGVALPVDPGRHVIIVNAAGYHDQKYVVDVARGEEKDIQIERGQAKAMDTRRIAGITVAGFGLASLAVGVTTGAFALSNLQASNAECAGNLCSTQDGVLHYQHARDFALVSDIMLSVGVTLVATGVVLWVLSHGNRAADMHSLAIARF